MKIRLKMFAILKDRSGVSEIELELPEAATVADAVSLIRQRFEAIAELLPQVAAAVNLSYAERSHVLRDGDELALIPPVSGGVR